MAKICNMAHLRALIRNGWLLQKKAKCILIFELILILNEGLSMGLNVQNSLKSDNPTS